MPPLYLTDDYDRCLDEGTAKVKAIYCYTRTQIKPNDTSPLWKIIEEFSANHKRHFRHDRLNRGICINWCKPHFKDFVRSAKRKFIQEQFENETEITFDPNSLTRGLDDRIRYNKLVNMCVNRELKSKYELMAYSTVEYCITNHDVHEKDSLDWWFFWIFVGLIKVLISSTLYDFFLKRRNIEHNNSKHYQQPVNGKYSSIMVSFSIPRNWYRLMAESKDQIARDLRPINAIRLLTMFCVMMGHSALFMNILPSSNPQYMEKNYYRIVTQLLINGATVIQTFFAISGYLLSIQFMKLRKNNNFSIHYLWKSILYRYLRLTPVYMFLLFFNVTWLISVQEGPFWPHITDTERTFCRKNWWTNLLYVNNIFGVSEPCFQHGWYLAADFQMFIVGVIMQMIFWKYPRSTKILLSLGILVSYIIPGIVTYTNKFEGAFMATLENQRYALWYDQMYAKMYIPAYTNFGSFLCGMIGGILYYKYRQEDNRPRKSKSLMVIWYATLPIVFPLLLSGFIFYHYDFNKPLFWIALYSSLLKNIWGLYGATVITGLAFGLGWIIREVMCHPVFRPLGRLTYCAFLVHPAIIRIYLGNQRHPIYSSDMTLVTNTMSLFLQSYIVALVLCICMEFPISALQRHFFDKETDAAERTKQKRVTRIEMIRSIQTD